MKAVSKFATLKWMVLAIHCGLAFGGEVWHAIYHHHQTIVQEVLAGDDSGAPVTRECCCHHAPLVTLNTDSQSGSSERGIVNAEGRCDSECLVWQLTHQTNLAATPMDLMEEHDFYELIDLYASTLTIRSQLRLPETRGPPLCT